MTTPDTGDKYLERVRKLLAQAESVAGTPEADAFNERAAALMAQYGIDMAMLAADGDTAAVPGDIVIRVDNPYARDKGYLVGQVAAALGCRVVQRTRRRGKSLRHLEMHVFGMESDLRRVELLYTSLLIQIVRGVAQIDIPYYCLAASQVAAHRRSWMLGFSNAVFTRLKAAERLAAVSTQEARVAAGKSGPSTDLVLMDRTKLVEARRDAAYPDLKTSARRQLSGGGYNEGRAAGQRADLGAGRSVGKGARRELS